MRTSHVHHEDTNITGARRSRRTFAGLGVAAVLVVGAAACSSDDTEPGDDPIEVPADETLPADPGLDE